MEMDMETVKAMEKEGWHLTGERIEGEVSGDGAVKRPLREQLLDLDLKETGAPCLPDPQSLKHMRRLRGPLVLQVAAIDDISESKATNSAKSQTRLLRLQLTDGHTSVTAIEYQPISKISLDIPPGTKVKVSDITVHNGLLFLDETAISVLGGHVQMLYDAWKMERKYSGLVRATIKGSSSQDVSGPPPFRQFSNASSGHFAGAETQSSMPQRQNQMETNSCLRESHNDRKPVSVRIRAGMEPYRLRTRDSLQNQGISIEKGEVAEFSGESGDDRLKVTKNEAQLASTSRSIVDIEPAALYTDQSDSRILKDGSVQTSLEERIDFKESAAALPAQNRMAAQKLLEKKLQEDITSRGRGSYGSSTFRSQGRGRRGGRRARNADTQEPAVFTLDEWEARQSAASASQNIGAGSGASSFYSSDEALARRLQQELELESWQEAATKKVDESEQLRLSMFKFALEKTEDSSQRTKGRRGGRRQHH